MSRSLWLSDSAAIDFIAKVPVIKKRWAAYQTAKMTVKTLIQNKILQGHLVTEAAILEAG